MMRTKAEHRTPMWRPLMLLPFILLVAVLGSGLANSQGESPRLHGAVLAWADSHPGEAVPVVVQIAGESDAVAEHILAAGGTVEREFQIIPAIQAQVPESFVATLASSPDVAWVSLDAPVLSTATVDTSNLATTYPYSVNADDPWSEGYTGAGVGVAVVDTGISPSGHEDFKGADGNSRVIAEVAVNPLTSNITDGYGHGTHIAGIVGGDGSLLTGKYIGVAPGVNLLNVKVADDDGNATLSDVIAGLEFVYNNQATYNIRVVNLSLTSSVAQSYKTDPLCAAAEALWFNGVFVVAAAGNLGSAPDAVSYCPGNDPFVMTVGAIDDQGTTSTEDDQLTDWSSRGTTQDGFAKPELATPGRGIVSVIDTNSYLYKNYPGNVVDKDYFRLSGTSMSAGVMSGVAALVLERHSDWMPGELKCTLIATAEDNDDYGFYFPVAGGASDAPSPSCNSDAGLAPSSLLGPLMKVGVVAYVLGEPNSKEVAEEIGLDMSAAGIQGASLSSVDWEAIKWDAIKWDAIKWGAIKWDAIKWSAINWSAIKWAEVTPDGVDFAAIKWSAIKWSAIKWDAIKWSAITWSAIKWDAIKWSAIKWGGFIEK